MRNKPERFHIQDRWWTVGAIVRETGLTRAGVWARVERGVRGSALLEPVASHAQTQAEAMVRRRLTRMARRKYATPCPNCGMVFDVMQPGHILARHKIGPAS